MTPRDVLHVSTRRAQRASVFPTLCAAGGGLSRDLSSPGRACVPKSPSLRVLSRRPVLLSTGRSRWPALSSARRVCLHERGVSPHARTRRLVWTAPSLLAHPCARAFSFHVPAYLPRDEVLGDGDASALQKRRTLSLICRRRRMERTRRIPAGRTSLNTERSEPMPATPPCAATFVQGALRALPCSWSPSRWPFLVLEAGSSNICIRRRATRVRVSSFRRDFVVAHPRWRVLCGASSSPSDRAVTV